jgi:2-phosphosulfolactate phosphatase
VSAIAKGIDIVFRDLSDPVVECDVAVVIDVLRAFTTAARAFAAGAHEILVAESPDAAREAKARDPELLTMGEVGGYKVPDFDFGNSPVELANSILAGRRLVQSTTSGTRGIVQYQRAPLILAASFNCAQPTVTKLSELSPRKIAMVITGSNPHNPDGGAEDLACAEFLAQSLAGQNPHPEDYLQQVRQSRAAQRFTDPQQTEFDPDDLALALQVDAVPFAMVCDVTASSRILRPSYCGPSQAS